MSRLIPKDSTLTEPEICRIFLANPNINPVTGRKLMRGRGPYMEAIDICVKNGYSVDHLTNIQIKPSSSMILRPTTIQQRPSSPRLSQERPLSPRLSQERLSSPRLSQERPLSPRLSQERPSSPRLSQERPLSPRLSQERPLSPRNLRPSTIQQRSRIQKVTMPKTLLYPIYVTTDEFAEIKNKPYRTFIDEVIKLSNSIGHLERSYFDEKTYGESTIIINIPNKYKTKRSGSHAIELYNINGFTNGQLLYKLAPYITSNYPDWTRFEGLKLSKSAYILELSYDW